MAKGSTSSSAPVQRRIISECASIWPTASLPATTLPPQNNVVRMRIRYGRSIRAWNARLPVAAEELVIGAVWFEHRPPPREVAAEGGANIECFQEKLQTFPVRKRDKQ